MTDNRNPRSVHPRSFDYPALRRRALRNWIRSAHAVPEANPPPVHIDPVNTETTDTCTPTAAVRANK